MQVEVMDFKDDDDMSFEINEFIKDKEVIDIIMNQVFRTDKQTAEERKETTVLIMFEDEEYEEDDGDDSAAPSVANEQEHQPSEVVRPDSSHNTQEPQHNMQNQGYNQPY